MARGRSCAAVALALASVLLFTAAELNAPGTTGVLQASIGGKRTLVLADGPQIQDSHSMFFSALEARGHELAFRFAGSADVPLTSFGEREFDNLVLLAQSLSGAVEKGSKAVTVADIMEFIEDGGNVLMAGGDSMGTLSRSVGALCGVDFDPQGSRVVDHFTAVKDEQLGELEGRGVYANTAIKGEVAADNALYLGSYSAGRDGAVVFSGVGHEVDDENYLATKVLTASGTAYSADPTNSIGKFPENAGRDTLLVSAVQARTNARMLFTGSLAMFSNRFFTLPEAGNNVFCSEISKWVFAERGILRASSITHTRQDGSDAELLLKQKERRDLPMSLFPEPEIAKNSQVYRVKDNVTYSVVIEEFDSEKGGWRPYTAEDVQMEFVMLDAYERITLEPGARGLFKKTFTVPDTYGIFKFRVHYRRPGYTVLSFSTQVSIRPFTHSEYERFLVAAYPYYASALSVMVGFLMFCAAFLYSKDEAPSTKASQ
ncbi:Oligosaccharyltransferase, OST48 subunit (or beta subunit) [Ectocarpus siliculosus]|uniref:Dolichyl-diphosphooligosaccharide--protein glycosyltransferase 48 kDa subunit n=1 Tax=Ectocarpus siliculosus TaxID=2880 RepID=D7G8P3_ECTSI|nr:Oligosaccharyltransferase, OST48 subunit (or beta subunit) [Ectocarpus siliculosus]|eukprot:CBJ28067.1 Oligosaccharyltransferase, OST48 subunit (or beta subunit) [Ectocarpus siliculosus]